MVIVFPQATLSFNNLFSEMIKKSKASAFLDKSLSSYEMSKISMVILIVLENPIIENYLNDYLCNSTLVSDFRIVVLKKETSGSICTTLMATPLLKNKKVIISALDQIILGKKINIDEIFNSQSCEVVVPTIISKNSLLSYVLKDDFGNVIQLFEKKLVSDEAILGLYFFQNFSSFISTCYDLLLKYKGFKNRTFFTSDVINNLIMQDYKINFPLLELDYKKVKSIESLEKVL